LKVPYQAYELDEMSDGNAIRQELYKMTNQRTVPSVWVGGKFVGGCDNTTAKYRDGSLRKLFDETGIKYTWK